MVVLSLSLLLTHPFAQADNENIQIKEVGGLKMEKMEA